MAKKEEKKDDFSIDDIAKKLHEEIPHTAKHVSYDAMKWQMEYMKSLEQNGRIKDFRLDEGQAKEAASAIMKGMRQTFLTQYLLANNTNYDAKMFNQSGVDAMILRIFGINEFKLREELEGKEMTTDAMQGRARQYAQRGAQLHQEIASAPLEDYKNLEKTRKYIVDTFQKAGITVKNPDRIDAPTAGQYLQAIKSGEYRQEEFLKTQPSMLKKYEPPKK
jgi:hypothetical protein